MSTEDNRETTQAIFFLFLTVTSIKEYFQKEKYSCVHQWKIYITEWDKTHQGTEAIQHLMVEGRIYVPVSEMEEVVHFKPQKALTGMSSIAYVSPETVQMF